MHEEVKERIRKAIQKATDLGPGDVKKTADTIEKEIGKEWDELEKRWEEQDPKLLKWGFGVGGLIGGVIVGALIF